MKLFISADIEGTTGVTHWDETKLEHPSSLGFRQQMVREIRAACEGAARSGFREILVKDGHDSARNFDGVGFPKEVRILRGWAKNPLIMMAGLDQSFDAVAFVGYHSPAGSSGHPLAHTGPRTTSYVKINGELASEFTINSYTAALFGVPVAFVSGDAALCASAKRLCPALETVAVSEGVGNSSISISPELAVERIRENSFLALSGDLKRHAITLPKRFEIEIGFMEHALAYRAGFYPGAERFSEQSVTFFSTDYFEVLKFIFFTILPA